LHQRNTVLHHFFIFENNGLYGYKYVLTSLVQYLSTMQEHVSLSHIFKYSISLYAIKKAAQGSFNF